MINYIEESLDKLNKIISSILRYLHRQNRKDIGEGTRTEGELFETGI